MILATLLMALRELRRNTLRSLLTMLGIVIGVAAVIALVNIGEGATARVKADIGKLGDNLLIVRPGAGRRSMSFTPAPPFKLADAEAIGREVSGVNQVAPTVGSQQLVVWGNQNRQTTIMGGAGGVMPQLAAPSEMDQRLDIARIEGQVKASSVKKVADFVEKHPDESTSILRSWVHEG